MNSEAGNSIHMTRRSFLKTLAAGTTAASAAMIFPHAAQAEHPDVVSSATRTSIAFATNRTIQIQSPAEPVRYSLIDSHLHFTDFLERIFVSRVENLNH